MKYKRFWMKVDMENGQVELNAPVSDETNKAIAFAIRWVSFGMTLGFVIHVVRWW
jgi:hypothetical protein